SCRTAEQHADHLLEDLAYIAEVTAAPAAPVVSADEVASIVVEPAAVYVPTSARRQAGGFVSRWFGRVAARRRGDGGAAGARQAGGAGLAARAALGTAGELHGLHRPNADSLAS